MKQYLFSRRTTVCGILAAAFSCLAASPALADSPWAGSGLPWGDTSSCSAPPLSQPFFSARDSNWYTLAPGQSSAGFDGTGWSLSQGASITTGQLADGTTGSVLDLPSGSAAISPPMCVDAGYPTARTLVRTLAGGDGVHISVAYAGTKSATKPHDAGEVHGEHTGWTVSNQFDIHPGNLPGWQLVRFTLVGGGHSSDFQVYDFYVDPRMKY
jgi:hypothetical protein